MYTEQRITTVRFTKQSFALYYSDWRSLPPFSAARTLVRRYASTLLAVDPAGARAELEEIAFVINPKPVFNPHFFGNRTSSAARYNIPFGRHVSTMSLDGNMTTAPYIVGISYRFAARMLDASSTSVSTGSTADISYTLSEVCRAYNSICAVFEVELNSEGCI